MNRNKLILMAIAVAACAMIAFGQTWTPAPGSWVKVTGTSTLHDWEVKSEAVKGSLSFPADFFENQAASGVHATVVIGASSLQSHSGRMDRVMYEALKVKEHPEIRYVLRSAKATSANAATITGDLTIAGKTKEVPIEVSVARPEKTGLILTGTVPINMKDFGIDPPTAMLGTVRTGEKVEVTFQWSVKTEK